MEVTSALSRYEDFYIIEKGLSTNTHLGYRNDLQLFINYLHSQEVKNIEEIQSNHILGFISYRSPQVARKTLNREKSVIKSFLLYCLTRNEKTEAKDNNNMNKDFSRLLTSESYEEFFPTVLTYKEIKQLFQVIENRKQGLPYQHRLAKRDHLILEMLYALGLRVSELIGIRLSDLDRTGWCRVVGKGDKIRFVPLLPQTERNIAFYLKNIRPHFLPSNHLTKDEESFFFLNKNGKKLSRVAIWKWVKRISLEANLNKSIFPHTFRHTCATHLLKNGADLRVIQELLGHSNIQTTELYTHLLTDDIKQTFANYHPLYE